MNVNCKISLTDEQRNTLKQKMAGKPIKAMVSRKEVCELVNDYIDSLLNGEVPTEPDAPEVIEGHDECCRANALLLARIDKQQRMLDKLNARLNAKRR